MFHEFRIWFGVVPWRVGLIFVKRVVMSCDGGVFEMVFVMRRNMMMVVKVRMCETETAIVVGSLGKRERRRGEGYLEVEVEVKWSVLLRKVF